MKKRMHGEGTYDRRGDRVRYRVMVDGRMVVGSGDSAESAKAAAEEKIRIGATGSTQTIRDLFKVWCVQSPESLELQPTTRDQYASLLGTHVVPVVGSVRIEKLDRRKVKSVFAAMDDSSQSTKKSSYAAFKKLMAFAISRGVVEVNVVQEVDRPKSGRSQSVSTDSTIGPAMIKAASGHRLEVGVWLAFGAGLRRGEILGLRWSDVDLDAGLMLVAGNVTRSSAGLQRGATKTGKPRTAPLSAPVVAALRAHRKRQAAERLTAGPAWVDNDLVIATEVGGLVEPRNYSRVYARWARKAKVGSTRTHLGRHYAATTMVASNCASIADIAASLGHSPEVLLKTYAHPIFESQRNAANALGSSLQAAADQ